MKISIIGSNGLISSEIGKYCSLNKIDVISFGNNPPKNYKYKEFNKVNLLLDEINFEKLLQSDVIVYASGAGIQSNLTESYDSIFSLNTYVPINIAKRLNHIRYEGVFITFGTYFEIGDNSISKVFSENEIINSRLHVPSDYCVSKRLLTRFIDSSIFSFKSLHLVLPTIYGENEKKHRLIPYIVSSIKGNKPMQFTKGNQIRQYLYVGDLPKIIFKLFSLGSEGIYNISGTETYTVRKIVEKIHEFYDCKTNDELFGKAERSDVGMQNLQLDDSLIKNLIKNVEYTSFDEVLKLYDNAFKK